MLIEDCLKVMKCLHDGGLAAMCEYLAELEVMGDGYSQEQTTEGVC